MRIMPSAAGLVVLFAIFYAASRVASVFEVTL